MKHQKLTLPERKLLGLWKKDNVANKECARRLERDIKTMRRELARNNTRVGLGKRDWKIIYEPLHAQFVSDERKRKAWGAGVYNLPVQITMAINFNKCYKVSIFLIQYA